MGSSSTCTGRTTRLRTSTAIYGGAEALVRIEDGGFIRGDLPRTARKLVLEWREEHVEELRANWELAQQPVTLQPIAPLR